MSECSNENAASECSNANKDAGFCPGSYQGDTLSSPHVPPSKDRERPIQGPQLPPPNWGGLPNFGQSPPTWFTELHELRQIVGRLSPHVQSLETLCHRNRGTTHGLKALVESQQEAIDILKEKLGNIASSLANHINGQTDFRTNVRGAMQSLENTVKHHSGHINSQVDRILGLEEQVKQAAATISRFTDFKIEIENKLLLNAAANTAKAVNDTEMHARRMSGMLGGTRMAAQKFYGFAGNKVSSSPDGAGAYENPQAAWDQAEEAKDACDAKDVETASEGQALADALGDALADARAARESSLQSKARTILKGEAQIDETLRRLEHKFGRVFDRMDALERSVDARERSHQSLEEKLDFLIDRAKAVDLSK